MERIGRYRLDKPLGSGAFAVVWLAHDDSFEAPVAVKVMAENWAYRLDLRERFLAEARMLRKAASSRVVQVYDVGELDDERPYFVMEYAERGTLADRLVHGALPLGEALRMAAETARGVAVLHGSGIVHRDIKPSNVLLQAGAHGQDRVLVADLGLAKSLAHASGLTMSAGSAGYMAPEQFDGTDGIDERADVYGLGALAYHLLTGVVPGAPGKVVRPGKLREDLPEPVQRAVMRALVPDRERRWPSALAFAQELDALNPAAPATPPRRRTRRLLAATVVGVLAVAGAAVGARFATSGSSPKPSSLVQIADTTGRITAQIPTAWSGQLRAGGWNPSDLGLPSGHEPGLEIADTLPNWLSLGSIVNGAFFGLGGTSGDLAKAVAGLTHQGCTYRGSTAYTGSTWHGQVRRWDDCQGGTGSLEEISLTPLHATTPAVYVQIRQAGGRTDATNQVLGGLRVTG